MSRSHRAQHVAPVALLLLGLALACASPQQPPVGADGAQIYALQLCANCHGEAGEGRSLGPPLRDLGQHWSVDRLADFLADPDRWERDDARLARLADEYSGNMDTYANLSPAERERLARWLLRW